MKLSKEDKELIIVALEDHQNEYREKLFSYLNDNLPDFTEAAQTMRRIQKLINKFTNSK